MTKPFYLTTQTTTKMCQVLEMLSLPFFRGKVRLAKDPFRRTDKEMVVSYYFDNELKELRLRRGEDAGEFFKGVGLIDEYKWSINGFKMYKQSTIPITGPKGIKVEMDITLTIEWDSIKFVKTELIEMCAVHEYTLRGRFLGLEAYKEPARIITMEPIIYSQTA